MNIDLERTFVTSDHHFRAWKRFGGGFFAETSEADEEMLIERWNAVVPEDGLVLYVGDFCDGYVADLMELRQRLNGRIILIKGNHDDFDRIPEAVYRMAFDEVQPYLHIPEFNLLLIHNRHSDDTTLAPGERMVFGHEHRYQSEMPSVANAVCVCAGLHDWTPLRLSRVLSMMTT